MILVLKSQMKSGIAAFRSNDACRKEIDKKEPSDESSNKIVAYERRLAGLENALESAIDDKQKGDEARAKLLDKASTLLSRIAQKDRQVEDLEFEVDALRKEKKSLESNLEILSEKNAYLGTLVKRLSRSGVDTCDSSSQTVRGNQSGGKSISIGKYTKAGKQGKEDNRTLMPPIPPSSPRSSIIASDAFVGNVNPERERRRISPSPPKSVLDEQDSAPSLSPLAASRSIFHKTKKKQLLQAAFGGLGAVSK
mmetsp:Transcript_47924/g.124433  ORF Transcript_47924/g.124433 Transcript_47924/m.124433 type:complete len:252 (-) Transcript_47924:122-877(-)